MKTYKPILLHTLYGVFALLVATYTYKHWQWELLPLPIKVAAVMYLSLIIIAVLLCMSDPAKHIPPKK